MCVLCYLLPIGLASQFTEQGPQMGIDHYTYDPSGMAGGVAILDYDRDGHQDIYLTGGLAPDVLYRNLGNGTFTDVTKEMGISFFNIVKTMGVVAADIDGDGFTDLFVTTADGDHCYLLRNEEGRFFADVSLSAGIRHEAWSSSATLADYDGDGDLDIYVGNYVKADGEPFDQFILGAQPDFLYRNEGRGQFTLVPTPLADARPGCTLATLFSDYDRDGEPDLFILNDFGDYYEPNNLLRNLGDESKQFESVGQQAKVRAAINSMGIASGDLNEDGYTDYYVTNIGDNLLYLGSEEGTFRQVATELFVNDGTGMSWGTVIQDFDNDGHLDLYVNKGYLHGIDVAQFNRVYLGDGSTLQFDDRSRYLYVRGVENKARGVAWGDLNNDGFVDLVVSGVRLHRDHSARTLVYMNEGKGGNWLKIKLTGKVANTEATGARLTVYAGGHGISREYTSGGSYLSGNESVVHIGLGSVTSIDSLVVDWPAPGAREVFDIPDVNTTYRLLESDQPLSTSAHGPHSGLRPQYQVYPQPAHELVQLRWTQSSDTPRELCLLDLNGRTLHSQEVLSAAIERSQVLTYRLPSLPAGIYLLQTRSANGIHVTRLVID